MNKNNCEHDWLFWYPVIDSNNFSIFPKICQLCGSHNLDMKFNKYVNESKYLETFHKFIKGNIKTT